MQDEFNPYAAPTTSTMHPRAAEWLRSTDDPSLQKVARGLGLIYISIVIILLSAILFGVTSAMAGVQGARGAAKAMEAGEVINPFQVGGTMGTVLILFLLGIFVGYIIDLIGSFMCLATPEETGAKGLITVALALTVISIVISIANNFVKSQSLGGLANIINLISVIIFVLFLKKLAEFIGAEHLARRARNILVAMGVGLALLIVSIGMMLSGNLGALGIAGLLMAVLGIGGLVVFVMYANLINNLRKAIQSGGQVYA